MVVVGFKKIALQKVIFHKPDGGLNVYRWLYHD